MMGVTGVLARISELQTQLGVAPAATTAGTRTAFASALADATGGTTARTGATGEQVVAAAKKYLGVKYVFGSTDPARGLDCSALVQRAYRELGVDLPRTSAEQARAGTRVDSLKDARPGDILAFNAPVDHVAIYLGDNKMIAAPKPGDQVKIQSVYETPTHIRRVVGTDSAAAAFPTTAVRPASLQTSGALPGVPYADMFLRAGAKYDVSPKLLAAVAKVESGYNPKAVSPAGAQGLMQLMPGTARGLGVKNSFDPEQAINGAAKLLASHLKEFKSVPLALAAYNAGGSAVHRHGGIPPFAETQAYVPKVQKALAKLG
ncbi:transglycosylase SLT domain-containing protein [Jidongwangia harbinensis]|uniref:transglycosylase SLT domain-containing protein n=1 Tax=Jidongwangia harbinensis TaxID=2878561 RepID=UPI001CD969B1|nr:transglycosylase SLT domain-containing protein [Jidongwangia harbinensis]MCA2213710.1 transglycosylase SLT domain-containing protein [Jidongwangia harbinensis]